MPDRDFLLGTSLDDRFAAWAAGGIDASEPRPAATIMLVRDAGPGVEVFMQHRVSTMAFAPNRYVFPGGRVDASDAEPLPWAGPAPAEWAQLRGVSEPEATAIVVACLRELFEEAGVLLAGPDAGSFVDGGSAWAAEQRRRIERRETTLAEVLTEQGLVARTDALGYHARWITPELEPRRYDTFFFTALLPPGQQADGDTSEAQRAGWVRPQTVLDGGRSGLMPPTVVCLEDLAAASSPTELIVRRAGVVAVRPRPAQVDGGWVIRADLP